MIEFILALSIVAVNQAVMYFCEKASHHKEHMTSITFLLKTNAMRAGAVVALVIWVAARTDLNPVVFVLSFMTFYLSGLFINLIHYGTKQ